MELSLFTTEVRNPHTKAYIDAEHEKTGASKRDIRDGLKCYKCGGRYHISKDCGKKEDNEQKQKHSESSAMSATDKCVAHGGGKRCTHERCKNVAVYFTLTFALVRP